MLQRLAKRLTNRDLQGLVVPVELLAGLKLQDASEVRAPGHVGDSARVGSNTVDARADSVDRFVDVDAAHLVARDVGHVVRRDRHSGAEFMRDAGAPTPLYCICSLPVDIGSRVKVDPARIESRSACSAAFPGRRQTATPGCPRASVVMSGLNTASFRVADREVGNFVINPDWSRSSSLRNHQVLSEPPEPAAEDRPAVTGSDRTPRQYAVRNRRLLSPVSC